MIAICVVFSQFISSMSIYISCLIFHCIHISCSVTKLAHFGIITLQLVIFILIYNRKNYDFFVIFAFNFAVIVFFNHKLYLIYIPLHSLYAKTLIENKKVLFYHLYIHSYSNLSIWWRSFWIFANKFFSWCTIRVHFYRLILDIIIYMKDINLACTEFIPGMTFNRQTNSASN